jgi:hypothetical protein
MLSFHSRLVIGLLFFGLAMPLSLASEAQKAEKPADPGQYVLFIHAGHASSGEYDDLVRKVTIALAKSGYVVRAPDQERKQDGPGVDFFDETNRPAAEHIASVVNEQKGEGHDLKVRLQPVKRPQGYIDVWLF